MNMQQNYANDFIAHVKALNLDTFDPEIIRLLFTMYKNGIKVTMGENYNFLGIEKVLQEALELVFEEINEELKDRSNWNFDI